MNIVKDNQQARSSRHLTERLEVLFCNGEYQPGDKLPPLRELAKEFNTSTYSVHSCMKRLQKKGLLTLRHGSGAYLSKKIDRAANTLCNIAAFVGPDQIGHLSLALMGAQQMAISQGFSVTLRKRDYCDFYSPELSLLQSIGDVVGIILFGQYDSHELELPGLFPVVGIEMSTTLDGRVSHVSLDPVVAAELAVKYFLKLGKEKIRILYLDKAPAFRFRAECFRFLWSAHGETEIEPYDLTQSGVVCENDKPETGLLFCSGSYCERCIVDYRRKTGREMTKDFDVLSIDGESLICQANSSVSTITVDWRAVGEVACREIIRRLESPHAEARHIYLIPKIVEVN